MSTEIGWTWVPDGKGSTKIGRTLNHQVGCKEVSRACEKCYAAKLAHRGMSPQHKGLTVMRTNTAGKSLGVHWNGEINRVPKMLEQPLRWRKPSGIFVGSMTDTFFDVSTDDACRWIAALFGVMAAAQQHTYMLLTKRPENARTFFAWLDRQSEGMEDERAPVLVCLDAAIDVLTEPRDRDRLRRLKHYGELVWPLPSVWMGVTAEDQRRADERIPILLGLPAAVRYVSYEPAVGPVDFREWLTPLSGVSFAHGVRPSSETTRHGERIGYLSIDTKPVHTRRPALDQIIAGGESGPGASPSHPDWFRSARDQCAEAGVPFFFKQWGAWTPDTPTGLVAGDVFPSDPSRAGEIAWSTVVDSTVRKSVGKRIPYAIDSTGKFARLYNVGADAAGRVLDGRTHDGFPTVPHG